MLRNQVTAAFTAAVETRSSQVWASAVDRKCCKISSLYAKWHLNVTGLAVLPASGRHLYIVAREVGLSSTPALRGLSCIDYGHDISCIENEISLA